MILNRASVNKISKFIYNTSLNLLIIGLPIIFDIRPYSSIEATKVIYFELCTIILSFSAILVFATSDKKIARYKTIDNSRNEKYILVFVTLLMGSFILSIFTSNNVLLDIFGAPNSKKGTLALTSLLILYFTSRYVISDRRLFFRKIEVCVFGSIPVLIYAMVQYFDLDVFDWKTDSISHISSTLGRSNFLGNYLSIMTLMTCMLIIRRNRSNSRIFYSIVLLMQIICTYLTLSRGSWISLISGISILLLLTALKYHNRVILIFLAIALIFGSIMYVSMEDSETFNKLSNFKNQNTDFDLYRNDSIDRRISLWADISPIILKRWIFGYGFENFTSIDSIRMINQEIINQNETFFDDPHNIIMKFWISGGILSMIALIGIFVTFFEYCLYWYRAENGDGIYYACLIAFLVAFLIPIQFNPDTIVVWVMFWLILGITPALLRPARSATPVA